MASGTIKGPEMLFQEVWSDSFTLAANDATYNLTKAIPTITGYKPAAIAGWRLTGTNFKFCALNSLYIDENNALHFGVLSKVSSSVTLTLAAKIMYVKE